MSNIVSINTDNYSAMAKAMGMEQESSKSASTLPRLKLSKETIMGQKEVDGVMETVVKVNPGSFFLEFPEENDTHYYAKGLTIRPFMQRFFLRKWVNGLEGKKGYFVKSLMSDNLNVDLKDSGGTFNCGRPSGYIKDFKSLDVKMQEQIKAVDRVRSVFGTVTFDKVINSDGTDSDKEIKDVPFIWEVTGATAYKIVGETFKALSTMKRLPVQHSMKLTTEAKSLQSGGSFFVPKINPNYKQVLKVDEKEQEIFGNFIAWVEGFNGYISSSWDEKNRNNVSEEDMKVVDEFIEVDDNDEK